MFKAVLFIALCILVIAECKHTEQKQVEKRQVESLAQLEGAAGQMAERTGRAFGGMKGTANFGGMSQMPQMPQMPGMPNMPGMPSGR